MHGEAILIIIIIIVITIIIHGSLCISRDLTRR